MATTQELEAALLAGDAAAIVRMTTELQAQAAVDRAHRIAALRAELNALQAEYPTLVEAAREARRVSLAAADEVQAQQQRAAIASGAAGNAETLAKSHRQAITEAERRARRTD